MVAVENALALSRGWGHAPLSLPSWLSHVDAAKVEGSLAEGSGAARCKSSAAESYSRPGSNSSSSSSSSSSSELSTAAWYKQMQYVTNIYLIFYDPFKWRCYLRVPTQQICTLKIFGTYQVPSYITSGRKIYRKHYIRKLCYSTVNIHIRIEQPSCNFQPKCEPHPILGTVVWAWCYATLHKWLARVPNLNETIWTRLVGTNVPDSNSDSNLDPNGLSWLQ